MVGKGLARTEHALDGAGADAKLTANLEVSVSLDAELPDAFVYRCVTPFSRARASPALTRSRMMPRSKLSEDAEHLKHCPACGSRRIEPLLVQE